MIVGINTQIDEGVIIADDVFIGNSVTIREGTVIEDGVCIGHGTVIEEDCQIGKDTRIQALAYLAKGTVIEDSVFIGPMVCTTNDKHILSHGRGEFVPNAPHIERGVRIGARALIMPGVTVEENSLIGAGSVVNKRVGTRQVWYGQEAEHRGVVPDEEVV